jgi:hypothetical protein
MYEELLPRITGMHRLGEVSKLRSKLSSTASRFRESSWRAPL